MQKTAHSPLKSFSLLHPILFAACSAIIMYVEKADASALIPPQDVILPTLFALTCSLLLALSGAILTRKAETAALIASLFVLGFFHLWPIYLATICIVGLGAFLVWMLRRKIRLMEVNLILTMVSLFILSYYLYRYLDFVNDQHWCSSPYVARVIVDQTDGTIVPENAPDIYYIILDGYGRADMLNTVYGYDNSGFITALEQRGFFVASRSQANYPRTLLSLSSSLNMQYLDRMPEVMGESDLWWPIMNTIQHSELRSFLEAGGYRTIFLASGWDYSDIRDGDEYLSPYRIMLRDFDKTFVRITNLRFLGQIDWAGLSYPSYDMHRRLIHYEFATLVDLASNPGPKFVFAHILAPHAPFVFAIDGEPVDPDYPYSIFDARGLIGNMSQYRQSYIDQLTYINQLTLAMIDGILAGSTTPPVIVIQGDHGPDSFLDYTDYHNSCLYERFSILNAYYLPGVQIEQIPDDISPVNSFRLITNQYLGTDLEILPNDHYFSPSPHLYQFQDVSDLTENPCDLPEDTLP